LIQTPPKNEDPNQADASHPFADKDLLIIGDVSPEHLKEENWKQIKNVCRRSGGHPGAAGGKKNISRWPITQKS